MDKEWKKEEWKSWSY